MSFSAQDGATSASYHDGNAEQRGSFGNFMLSSSEPGVQFVNTDYDFVDMSIKVNSSSSLSHNQKNQQQDEEGASSSSSAVSPEQVIDMSDMSDLVDNELNSQALALCKKYVLQHYFRLLKLIAWEPFASCNIFSCCCCSQPKRYGGSDAALCHRIYLGTINILYPILVVAFLLYSYAFDVIGCQWVVDVAPLSPIMPAIVNFTTTKQPPTTTSNSTDDGGGQLMIKHENTTTPLIPIFTREACGAHWFTTHIIPSLLHFTAYAMGFVYFRLMRSELVEKLIERVFLNSALVKNRNVMSLARVIRKLRIILTYGLIWVVLATALYAFFLSAFPDHSYQITHDALRLNDNLYYFLLALRSIGYTLANLVTLTVVFNFVVQCEMLCFYFEFIFHRLREKAWNISDAFKHVFNVSTLARQINLFQSHLTSVVMFKLLLVTVIGLISLFRNTQDTAMVWAYKAIFPAIWFIPVVYCFAEAARLYTYYRTLIAQALEMRVFGYSSATSAEIDSFIAFLRAANVRTKLFHVGMRPVYLLVAACIFSFGFVILFQLGTISFGPLTL